MGNLLRASSYLTLLGHIHCASLWPCMGKHMLQSGNSLQKKVASINTPFTRVETVLCDP